MPSILPGNVGSATATTGYDVANSLMFDGADSYLNITSGSSPTSTKKFTVSFWLKRSELGREQHIFGGVSAAQCYFINDDRLRFADTTSGTNYYTTQVFRDVSAWYHIVIAVDTTLGTAGNRARIYVNGSEITEFDTETNATQNNNTAYNIGSTTYAIGRYNPSQSQNYYYSGYMAEYVFIDGQQLTPTSFGEFDSDTPNVWKPIDVSGLTFGNNGYHLDFEDSSALGNDVSGNDNDYTANNISATDQSTDTCTNNFATLNPLLDVNATPTFTDGNLVFQGTGSTNFVGATIPVSSGKWYVEVKATTVNGSYPIIGVIDSQSYKRRDSTYFVGSDINTNNPSGFAVFSNGNIYHNNSSSYGALGTTYTSGDIIGLALDMDSGTKTLGFYKNGSLQTTINLDEPPSGTYMFASGVHSSASSAKGEFNFGNPTFSISSGNSDANGYGNFEYSVPSGYYSINTKNLAEFG